MVTKQQCNGAIPRWALGMIAVGMVLFFGAGYAYSGLRAADQSLIRIAYANGYKDALEYAFTLDRDKLNQLQHDHEQFKSQVLYQAEAYVSKVASMN